MSRGGPTKPVTGQHVRFIRYVASGDGWSPEVLRGEFEERTGAGWLVRIAGEVRELAESEWSFYRE